MRQKLYANVYREDDGTLTDKDGQPLRTSDRRHKRSPRRQMNPDNPNMSAEFIASGTAPRPSHFNRKFPNAIYRIDDDTYWQNGKIYRRKG